MYHNKNMLNKIKKYTPYIALALALILLLAVTNKKEPKEDTAPADYTTTTGEESVVTTSSLDQTPGDTISSVEETHQNLQKTSQESLGKGFTMNRYVDKTSYLSFDIITNEETKVMAVMRSALSDQEKSIASFKEYYKLGTPEAVMYLSKSTVGTVHVYTKQGVAVVFEEYSGQVYYVATFDSMPFNQFKQVFSSVFQDTPDRSVY